MTVLKRKKKDLATSAVNFQVDFKTVIIHIYDFVINRLFPRTKREIRISASAISKIILNPEVHNKCIP